MLSCEPFGCDNYKRNNHLRGFDDDADALRFDGHTDGHCDLFGQSFLDLQTTAVNLDDPADPYNIIVCRLQPVIPFLLKYLKNYLANLESPNTLPLGM